MPDPPLLSGDETLTNAGNLDGAVASLIWEGVVNTHRPGIVNAKWYDVWTAAVALDAMCVRPTGRGGTGVTTGGSLTFSLRMKSTRGGSGSGTDDGASGVLGFLGAGKNGTLGRRNVTESSLLAS